MKKSFFALGTLFLAVLVLAGCGTQSQNQAKNQSQEVQEQGNGDGQGKGPQGENGQAGPPEEAISACAELSEGDSCSFTRTQNNGDEEERTGTCKANPKDETLTCMSDEMRGPGGPNDGSTEN